MVKRLHSEGGAQTSRAGPGPRQGADTPRRCPRVPRDHSPTVLHCTAKPQGGVPTPCAPPLGYPLLALIWPARPSSAHVAGARGWWPSLPPSSSASRGPAPRAPHPRPACLSRLLPAAPGSPRPGPGVRTANRDWSRLRHGTRQPPARAAVDTHLDRRPGPRALSTREERKGWGTAEPGGDSAPGGRAWVPGKSTEPPPLFIFHELCLPASPTRESKLQAFHLL